MGQQQQGPARAMVVALTVTVALIAGCSSPGEEGRAADARDTVELGGPGDGIELIASLARYDSCDAFLDDVKAEALERVGPYGLGGLPFFGGRFGRAMDGAEMADDADAPSGFSGTGPGSDDPGFSGTNLQEAGVDEPDRVKTDGSLLATVGGDHLHLLDVSDPTDPQLLSSTPLAGHGAELLLHGDRLVVLQHSGQYWGPPQRPLEGDAIGAPARSDDDSARDDAESDSMEWHESGPYVPSPEVTTVALVDISDPSAPRAERTWTVEGGYVSARVVDGTARIIARSDPSADLPFVYPSGPNAEDAATEANRAVITASTIEDWVPSLTLTDSDGTVVSETQVAPCDQLHRPSVFSGFGMVSVLTADLDGDGIEADDGIALLSSGETVYASPTSLFVATHQWIEPDSDASSEPAARSTWRPAPGHQRTDVHQFAIDDAGPARYVASGSVDGQVLNQFSMSEHEGDLRIAVTEDQWSPDSVSSVVVLARSGESLEEIGRVGDLGVTEQIYAVRFMGDRAYVVTFRQIDPFYTIDLSDPTAPQMLGELKIPGFSSYLHPVGPDLIMGIGQDATDEGMAVGGQVSLFDVSDASDPRRVAQLDLGEWTHSEVEHDHRAFLFWDGLAVLPFTTHRWDTEEGAMTTGAVAVEVDAAGRSVTERGRVGHADQPSGAIGEPSGRPAPDWEREHRGQVRRSLVIGDTLLTVSDRGVLASDLDTLETSGWAHLGG